MVEHSQSLVDNLLQVGGNRFECNIPLPLGIRRRYTIYCQVGEKWIYFFSYIETVTHVRRKCRLAPLVERENVDEGGIFLET